MTTDAENAVAQAGGTLAEAISDRIRSEILTGRKTPGTKLRLEQLKAEFGVSFSPVREALSRLVAEGLVTAEEPRGYSVAPVSRDNLAEVIRLRAVLEPMALRRSIEEGDDAWEARLLTAHHRLGKFESQRWDRRKVEEWESWHRRYHDELISGCASPILQQFCAVLHDLNDRYRRLFLASHDVDRDVAGEHKKITQAALDRNAEKACRLLETHISRTGRNILAAMSG